MSGPFLIRANGLPVNPTHLQLDLGLHQTFTERAYMLQNGRWDTDISKACPRASSLGTFGRLLDPALLMHAER